MIMSRAATAAAAAAARAAAHNNDDDDSDDDDGGNPPNPPVLFGFDRCLFLCGVVSPLLRASLMNIHSLDSLHTLVSLTNESLDTTATNVNKTRRAANEAPLVVNAIHLQRLKAMRLWATWQVRMAIPLREDDFNELHLEWGVDRMEFETRCKASDASDTPEPPKLKKIGFEIWQTFWRQFKNYCDTKRGAMKIPISYVFREHLVPTPEILAKEYADSDESLMMKVALTGPDFKFDNKTVWNILTRLVGDGSAWPFIKSLADSYNGRKAIEVLKTQSQGTASISSRQARAFQILKTTTYDGKSNKSSFDNFVGTLQFAFTELDDCDIILSGVQKVDYMLTGFTAPERLAVRNRIINTELESDFAECCSHISQYLAKSSIYDGPGGAKRAISSVGSNKKKIKFTNEEWNALTADEKSAVRALRKKLKKAKATTTPLAATVPKVAATPRTKVAAVTSTKATVDDDATSDEEVPMKPAAKKNK
jgi:hypothetical protein